MFEVSQIPWEIKLVSSADKALKRINQGGIDVVVTDLKMPGMDGIELLAKLMSKPKSEQIPVIMLTGKGDEEVAVETMHLGAADYLVKESITCESLQRAILNAIEKLRLHQQAEEYNRKLKQKVRELQETLTLVKQLEGLLPICMFCKRIRNDQNQWHYIEEYIEEHSEAVFTHSLCPECQGEHYPELVSI